MIMIRSVSIEVENAKAINQLVELGYYNSFSAFVREAVEEKLKKEK